MGRWAKGLAAGAALGSALLAAGCGLVLGLDEFEDALPAGSCRTAADCPGGDHGAATCAGGACTFACDEGFADCTEAPGCETATRDDPQNCGGCGVTCAAFCQEGACNDPVDLSVGPLSSIMCAILQDGSVWCWGRLPETSEETEVHTSPKRIDLPLPALQVAVGAGTSNGSNPSLNHTAHVCALLSDQTVRCWGGNELGQLGLGDMAPHEGLSDPGVTSIQQISANSLNTCAVNAEGVLYCWGAGSSIMGQSAAQAFAPEIINTGVRHVSMGFAHACSLMLDGTLECWGENLYGALGLGDAAPSTVPNPQHVGAWTGYLQVASGGAHTCARTAATTQCWGSNVEGQLGLGSTTDHNTPQLLNLSQADSVTVGGSHSGLMIGGDVYTWGDNTFNQLGTEDAFDAESAVKIELPPAAKLSFISIASCALLEDRRIMCWGSNTSGQLGDGTTTTRSTPAPVFWH